MTEPEHTEPCDYYREVHRISALLTDFDPNHSFSAVSDHVEALLKRFGAIAATPDAPSDPAGTIQISIADILRCVVACFEDEVDPTSDDVVTLRLSDLSRLLQRRVAPRSSLNDPTDEPIGMDDDATYPKPLSGQAERRLIDLAYGDEKGVNTEIARGYVRLRAELRILRALTATRSPNTPTPDTQ